MKKQAEFIKRIVIKGLWGRKDIAWDLRKDVNILRYWKKFNTEQFREKAERKQ